MQNQYVKKITGNIGSTKGFNIINLFINSIYTIINKVPLSIQSKSWCSFDVFEKCLIIMCLDIKNRNFVMLLCNK